MKKYKILTMISIVIVTTLIITSCEVLNEPVLEGTVNVNTELNYSKEKLSSTGEADLLGTSYKDLQSNLKGGNKITGFKLTTLSDDAKGDAVNTIGDITFRYDLDDNKFWMGMADGSIWYTLDGGNTFVQNKVFSTPIDYVRFFDDNNGVVLTNNKIYKTDNKGIQWTLLTVGISTTFYTPTNIAFVSPTNGWVITSDNKLLRTTNGSLWEDITSRIPSDNTIGKLTPVAFDFKDKDNGVIVFRGDGGLSKLYGYTPPFYTTNGGNTWEISASKNLYFTNADVKPTEKVYFTKTPGEVKFSAHHVSPGRDLKLIFNSTNNGRDYQLLLPYEALLDQKSVDNVNWSLNTSYTSIISLSFGYGFTTTPKTIYNFNVPVELILTSPKPAFYFNGSNSRYVVVPNGFYKIVRGSNFDFTFSIKNSDTEELLFSRELKDINISDWYTKPYTIILNSEERDKVSAYFKEKSKFKYDITIKDERITPFSFRLNMNTYMIAPIAPTK